MVMVRGMTFQAV